MRFFLVVAVWVIIIGGVFLYTTRRDGSLPTAQPVTEVAAPLGRTLALEITPTFNLEQDPFALATDEQPSLLDIRVNSTRVHLDAEQFRAGQVTCVKPLAALVPGVNEIFIQAVPPAAESGYEHGIRIKITEGPFVVAETTLWSAGGGLVAGTLHFSLAAKENGHEH